MKQTEVCVVGAGPGGAATALRLSYLGIPCVLVDKATFPRDKICGDAISGKVTTLINRLDPEMLERFDAEPTQLDIWGIRFYTPNDRKLDLPFQSHLSGFTLGAPGYVSPRLDFDNFLIEEVRRRDNIDFHDNTEVTEFEATESGWRVGDAEGAFRVETKLLVIANGAYSAFSRKVAGLQKDPAHYAGAVRAYYEGVEGMNRDFIELHFIKKLKPGYFWIFPLANGRANIGVGMRTDILSKRKVNLRKELEDIIAHHPNVSHRFRKARQLGKVVGYGLPLGSKTRPISGDNYMLVGDAAHLVDPLTGEGIGNAFYSGFIAAEQAETCLAAGNFSAPFLRTYDQRVQRVLGSEMKLSYRMQKICSYPVLLNAVANIINSNKRVIEYLSGMYTDFDLREKLVKPLFWLKMMWRK